MKWAFLNDSLTGGVSTVFRIIKVGLLQYGIEVDSISFTPGEEQLISDQIYGRSRISKKPNTDYAAAMNLLDRLESGTYKGVFVNVLGHPLMANCIRYLSPQIARIMIVHTISPAAYAAAKGLRDYVNSTICVSPRIYDDLKNHSGFARDTIFLVPNGKELSAASLETRNGYKKNQDVEIIWVGRVVDDVKGVFWLPKIIKKLKNKNFNISIVGDGPDRQRLQSQFSRADINAKFYGERSEGEVKQLLEAHHIFLMPSRLEGSPMALIEAMHAGCVPVVSRISGVTDFIIEDGKSGFLFEMGNTGDAAQQVNILANDPLLWLSMSSAAQARAKSRASVDGMINGYLDAIIAVEKSGSLKANPINRLSWKIDRSLMPTVRSRLPSGLKNNLRTIRERWKG